MKRIGLALLAGVLPVLSAAAHAATLGVSMALFDDNFLTAVRASMKTRAQQLNVPIQFEDAQNDIGRQLNQIQNFIAQKVDAIIVTPSTLMRPPR
jgi:ABC-type sugar transport system substrate-binding protein